MCDQESSINTTFKEFTVFLFPLHNALVRVYVKYSICLGLAHYVGDSRSKQFPFNSVVSELLDGAQDPDFHSQLAINAFCGRLLQGGVR